jgi:hypothetical protein
VDLLEDLVDVSRIGFDALLAALLLALGGDFLAALAGAFLDGVLAMVGNGWEL